MFRISFDTAVIGRQFLHFPVCESTNEIALGRLEAQTLQEGALILADYQTQGRGQRRTSWESAESLNLTFTVALFPDLAVQQQFYLNMMASLALTDCLKHQLGNLLKIKWPNDIYFQKSKLCGILIQNNLRVNKIQSCALGIGLNVNQLYFSYSGATSLKAISREAWDRTALLRDLAVTLEERYFQLKEGELAKLRQDYLSLLYRRGEWHLYRDKKGEFKGMISDIEEGGRLLIRRKEGVVAYDFKEVTFIH